MLLITGTPRSGTTMLAAYCKMMGNDSGGNYNDKRAGMEDGMARVSVESTQNGSYDAADQIIKRYAHPVLKLPHFLSRGRPELLERWAAGRPDLKLLILTRDPDQVAKSLHEDPEFFGVSERSLEETESLYREEIDAFRATVDRLRLPNHHLAFPDFVSDFGRVEDALTKFGGLSLIPTSEAFAEFDVQFEEGDTPESVWKKWAKPEQPKHR